MLFMRLCCVNIQTLGCGARPSGGINIRSRLLTGAQRLLPSLCSGGEMYYMNRRDSRFKINLFVLRGICLGKRL